MRRFYGEDLTSDTNGKISLRKKRKQKKEKAKGLNKAIFKPIQNNLEGED